jgi:hypothetical protein
MTCARVSENRIGRDALWLLAAVLLMPFPAMAGETKYPKEVQAVLDGARKDCRDAGGGEIKFGLGTVKKLNLTGGGNDYVVDLHEAECEGAASLFCGTGGCNLTILAGKQDGALVEVFDGRARGYEILPGKAPRTVRFQLHGSYCGGHGNPSCYRDRRITFAPFEFKQPE